MDVWDMHTHVSVHMLDTKNRGQIFFSIILCPIPLRQRLSFNLDLMPFHLGLQSRSDSGVPVPTMHNAEVTGSQ